MEGVSSEKSKTHDFISDRSMLSGLNCISRGRMCCAPGQRGVRGGAPPGRRRSCLSSPSLGRPSATAVPPPSRPRPEKCQYPGLGTHSPDTAPLLTGREIRKKNIENKFDQTISQFTYPKTQKRCSGDRVSGLKANFFFHFSPN